MAKSDPKTSQANCVEAFHFSLLGSYLILWILSKNKIKYIVKVTEKKRQETQLTW